MNSGFLSGWAFNHFNNSCVVLVSDSLTSEIKLSSCFPTFVLCREELFGCVPPDVLGVNWTLSTLQASSGAMLLNSHPSRSSGFLVVVPGRIANALLTGQFEWRVGGIHSVWFVWQATVRLRDGLFCWLSSQCCTPQCASGQCFGRWVRTVSIVRLECRLLANRLVGQSG